MKKGKTLNILTILNDIRKNNLNDFFYSLTINYENIVYGFENKKFDSNEIMEIINKYDKIKSFNLSLNNYGRFNESRYKSYYYNIDFIFHSDGIIFNFSSNYLSNREIVITSIDKLVKVCNEHKISSKKLYDIIKL